MEMFRKNGFEDSAAGTDLVMLRNGEKRLSLGIWDRKISSVIIYSGYSLEEIPIPGGTLNDIRRAGISESVCHNYEDDDDALMMYSSDSTRMIYISLSEPKQMRDEHILDTECYSAYDSNALISFVGIYPQN